jgi:hypothetical protein
MGAPAPSYQVFWKERIRNSAVGAHQENYLQKKETSSGAAKINKIRSFRRNCDRVRKSQFLPKLLFFSIFVCFMQSRVSDPGLGHVT